MIRVAGPAVSTAAFRWMPQRTGLVACLDRAWPAPAVKHDEGKAGAHG